MGYGLDPGKVGVMGSRVSLLGNFCGVFVWSTRMVMSVIGSAARYFLRWLSAGNTCAQHGLSKCEFIVTLAKSVLRKKTICSTRT